MKNLRKNGLIKLGVSLKENDILVGKMKLRKEASLVTKLLNKLFLKTIALDVSLRVNKTMTGRVYRLNIYKNKSIHSICIFFIEERKIEVGDKISGRHGNKGIISKILPSYLMPYMQDGTPIDVILNPLGIPSRMNIGQIYESLLNFSAINLAERYKISSFDEMQTGNEISKRLIYEKLNESRIRTKKLWVFNPNDPGKMKLLDGRTGFCFDQKVSVGYAYMLKLMHLVKDKINSRLTGPYSIVVKQPVRGKARKGGQRFGEMEVWALEGFGAAYNLQEILTVKSDDVTNRSEFLFSIINSKILPRPNIPQSFKTLVVELQALCLDIKVYSSEKKFFFN